MFTSEQIAAIGFEKPISAIKTIGYGALRSAYLKASELEKANANTPAAEIYELLASICSFHLKPGDKAEPYGPMFSTGSKRTAIPTDFRGDQAVALGEISGKTESPPLRARLADTAWINNKRDHQTAQIAVDAYLACIQLVVEGHATT